MREFIRSIFGSVGLDVRRSVRRPGGIFPSDPVAAQRRLLSAAGIPVTTVFDVGANLGQTAHRYRRAFPQADIFCFEPFPESIAALSKSHRGDNRVHVVPKAVGREVGRATFHVNAHHATNSLLPRPTRTRRYFPNAAAPRSTIEVEVTDLDTFVRDAAIERVDVLKLDIQGGELQALQGATNLLGAGNVSLIYTEIMFVPHYQGGALFHEICRLLGTLGFSLFDVYDLHHATNGQLRYGDALFVSDAIRRSAVDGAPAEP